MEPSFGLNAFNKAKFKNESETIASAFINLLFGKPGYMPSMPQLGLDIKNTLFMFWDEINPDQIKARILAQCDAFEDYIASGDLDVIKSSVEDQALLVIVVPTQIKDIEKHLVVAITQNDEGVLNYNYQYMSSEDLITSQQG